MCVGGRGVEEAQRCFLRDRAGEADEWRAAAGLGKRVLLSFAGESCHEGRLEPNSCQ